MANQKLPLTIEERKALMLALPLLPKVFGAMLDVVVGAAEQPDVYVTPHGPLYPGRSAKWLRTHAKKMKALGFDVKREGLDENRGDRSVRWIVPRVELEKYLSRSTPKSTEPAAVDVADAIIMRRSRVTKGAA